MPALASNKGRSELVRYFLFVLALPFNVAFAYEPQRAITNLAHELAECAGFYLVSAKVFDTQHPELAERGRNAADTAMEYSTALTNEKLTLARTEMAIKSMMKEIDNDGANFSILLNNYAEQCGKTVSDPVKRMEYWQKKQD
ncbi:hypothetical protein [Pseudomonas sp. OV226]|uniref:hypothetical protein n=1 Tax=Pseudomonas sp. OV226 TaxID=2135588 RepID=UPI000D78D2F3|nr:hypothetical protein [Pseudomonas sp. OV226]PWK30897.1 hypothetical protein C7534_12557 [Pseudomonas sp. OV226]